MSEARKKKLVALLRLAENNTSEAEAMAAISKAMEYAEKYGLNLEDIKANAEEVAADKYGSRGAWSGEGTMHEVDRCLARSISDFCTVKVSMKIDEDGDFMMAYFGHDADVDLAHWLRDTMRKAMDFEWEVYRDFVWKRKKGEHTGTVRTSFMEGMAARLRDRMKVVKTTRVEAVPTGRELVACKEALVTQRANEAGFQEAEYGRGRSFNVHQGAYAAGQAAGGRVSMGRGVSQGGVARIGKA